MKYDRFSLITAQTILALSLALGVHGAAVTGPSDHENARAALEAGEIMSLSAILTKLDSQISGQIIEVELEREGGQWIYEIKLLEKSGYRRKMKVDAKTAAVISTKQK